ncbi:hypothetical protein PR202_gb06768 [Eleusine coracana subsp. coracana]|uniref:Cyclic nucleotide-binding domain-containing protein n=1 Tax=Eleusine coracana subsp. coracana TaxID=191504 RepID=A0AAV5EBB5_ELECO|nr:hypothetical protein PR202_gb06768 [Eleusine coracana subsp. coracana]
MDDRKGAHSTVAKATGWSAPAQGSNLGCCTCTSGVSLGVFLSKKNMDDQLLDAMCDRLKPMLYTEGSCIIYEGDPVNEMLFIMRGSLESMTTNGGQIGFFNSNVLKGGDFCGEELLTWALDPNSASILPCSTRTTKTLSEVEAFALRADDLKFVATQFRRLHNKQLQHTFRFYSQQWRT